jgi:hypothetical protein
MIICKMGFKGLGDTVPARLVWQSGLGAAPSHRRTIARRKDQRSEVSRLSGHDGLVINSVFESCSSQSPYGFVQVSCIVEYPYDGRHQKCEYPRLSGSPSYKGIGSGEFLSFLKNCWRACRTLVLPRGVVSDHCFLNLMEQFLGFRQHQPKILLP